MPRKLTVRFECDRCARQWFVDYEDGQELPTAHSIEAVFKRPNTFEKRVLEVEFDTLCESCAKSIENAVLTICKVLRSKSPTRSAADKKRAKKSSPSKGELNGGQRKTQAVASA